MPDKCVLSVSAATGVVTAGNRCHETGVISAEKTAGIGTIKEGNYVGKITYGSDSTQEAYGRGSSCWHRFGGCGSSAGHSAPGELLEIAKSHRQG